MSDDYYLIARETTVPSAGVPVVRFTLTGEFDLGASDDLREALFEVVDAGGVGDIVVDLAGVEFIDSEAIGALLDGSLAARRAGAGFCLVRPQPLVRRVFTIIQMQHLFEDDPQG